MPARKKICILGESPLVEEFASLCVSKGHQVFARENERGGAAEMQNVGKVTKGLRADLGLELTNVDRDSKKKNLRLLESLLPAKALIVSSSTTITLAEQLQWCSHPTRLVGVGAFPTLLQGSLIECTESGDASEAARSTLREFVKSLEKELTIVRDVPGMVMPRILCMIFNEAYFAIQEGVAESRDIDTAMKLGTNYPRGPVDWASHAGLSHVSAVLSALYQYYGEDRYRIAPLLRRPGMYSESLHRT
jgi:3-hydroxybutyryl-CoA dehydrogenase